MLDLNKLLLDGGLMTAAFMTLVVLVAVYKPRLFLNKEDLPADIMAAVPPKTEAEKRQAVLLGIPLFTILIGGMLYSTYTFYLQSGSGFFALFLHALIIILTIAISDLVLLDWLVLNTITPKWVVFPGTEGFAGYKDYGFHLRAHLKALPAQVLGAAITAGLVLLAAQLV
ncbi:MAG: hypothetical protein WD751_05305 [Anaerolineales bacterium]